MDKVLHVDIPLTLIYHPTLSIVGEGTNVRVGDVTAPTLHFLRIVRQFDLSNQVMRTVVNVDYPRIIGQCNEWFACAIADKLPWQWGSIFVHYKGAVAWREQIEG